MLEVFFAQNHVHAPQTAEIEPPITCACRPTATRSSRGCALTMRCLPLKRWGYQLIIARLQVTVVIAVCLLSVTRSLIFCFCPVLPSQIWARQTATNNKSAAWIGLLSYKVLSAFVDFAVTMMSSWQSSASIESVFTVFGATYTK